MGARSGMLKHYGRTHDMVIGMADGDAVEENVPGIVIAPAHSLCEFECWCFLGSVPRLVPCGLIA